MPVEDERGGKMGAHGTDEFTVEVERVWEGGWGKGGGEVEGVGGRVGRGRGWRECGREGGEGGGGGGGSGREGGEREGVERVWEGG